MSRASNVLLCVGLLALLAIPATAFSQGGIQSGWTDTPATLNGKVGAAEWSSAAKVALYTDVIADPGAFGLDGWLGKLPVSAEEVTPQQATGWLYFMNDAQYLYLAATLDIGAPAGDPDYELSFLLFPFEDEPLIGDGRWAANLCSQNPDEGGLGSLHMAVGKVVVGPISDLDYDYFLPVSEAKACGPQFDPPGYRRTLGYSPMTFETRINLSTSPLDVAPGECFNAGVVVEDVEIYLPEEFLGAGFGFWPEDLSDRESSLPEDLGQVCLAAPEEEFVPEPGSIALLGTGLAGLGGYAMLRWRSRRKE
jgi:hypothetical protein